MKYLLMLGLILVGCSDRHTSATVNAVDGKNGYSIVTKITTASELECSNSGYRMDMFLDSNYSLEVDENDIYQNSLVICNGANGLQGIQGVQGIPGMMGFPGATGAAGPQGEQGPRGLTGAAGPQGLMGPMGATGPRGTTGAVGPQGCQGEEGPRGPTGATGPQGVQGIQGLQGIVGTNGTNGTGATIKNYSSSSCTLITNTTRYVKVGNNNISIFTNNTCGSNVKEAEVAQGESYWVSSNSLAIWTDGALRVITFN